MKSKIIYSTYVNIITVCIFLVLFASCILTVREGVIFFILLSLYIALILISFLYGVAYVKADPKYLILGSILKVKIIRIDNIDKIEPFQPTLGAIRICASGGFMGYWGIFKEGDIGRYYGFYGKSSDCFLVRMKNGDKYVVGCENPDKMIDYINNLIHKQPIK